MGIATGEGLTNGPAKARNRAFFSMFAVIAGGWMVFRALGPKYGRYIVSDEEREVMRGGDVNQTDFGNKTARAPERSLRSP